MAAQHETIAPAWSVRLASDLLANDETAKRLLAGLSNEQLNWQPAPGSWSVGQCLEHLCIMNEVYLPPISGRADHSWMVRRLVYPQLCRAHLAQQARSRSGEDQTRVTCRSLCSRS